ncbi:MAG TPA: beta-L-arabinofuranosidase domain-containing protein [Vicinamibacteria bacterium]|nr:beta-L-arabinofuranosidase domain-containing protein [Vicinamibacteria bacterium]
MNTRVLLMSVAVSVGFGAAVAASPVPDKVPPAVPDRQAFQDPDRTRLTGWLGARVDANEANRLLKVDTARLLEGYRKRPGRQSWDGEHVGKWLHAATLAWVNTGHAALREKLDTTVAELLKCQLADGYLGTYLEKDRWTDWDVWAHKYNLLGLVTYVRYTGSTEPLAACRRMADLLERTFGDAPGKRDIITAGAHVGMAPTSVLEPMALLYRMTGEPRYLEFCRYLLRSWEQPNGPKVLSTLLRAKRVDEVGNAKAYEMLSCLNGALELYRTTGDDPRILEASLNAWQDIVDKRLYLTGASSHGEYFHDDFDLPNVGNVGETCVTTTWLQFNAQLLRLTGEARFAEQLERVVLNQLFGAQKCDGSGWGYYVQMEGKKPYSSTLDGHCCLSSGPRGVALIPTFAVTTDADGVVVNLYDAGEARMRLADGTDVTLATTTRFPAEERVRIALAPSRPGSFALKLRLPAWSGATSLRVNGQARDATPGADGYARVAREWRKGDVVELGFSLEPRVVTGDHLNAGKVAILYGPLVLAADEALLDPLATGIRGVALDASDLKVLNVTPEAAPDGHRSWPGARVFRVNAITRKASGGAPAGSPVSLRMIPFADAGCTGSAYKVWLPLGGAPSGNLLAEGKETRSRPGHLDGSINDDDPQSFVVTSDGGPAAVDWYALTLARPVSIRRIVFTHGKTFPGGGWFDTTEGKPLVRIQASPDGEWRTVGRLEDYLATTATDSAWLPQGVRFSLVLDAPVTAFGVRIEGKPARGSEPAQAFSSCAEIEAFAN